MDLDRATARALTEAGYITLSRYIELFGDDNSPPVAPDHADHIRPAEREKEDQRPNSRAVADR